MQLVDHLEPVQRWHNSRENEVSNLKGSEKEVTYLEDFEKIESHPDENSGDSICNIFGYIRKIVIVIKLNIDSWIYTNPPRMKKQLKVKEITEIEREGVSKIVETWVLIANTKKIQANLLLPNVFLQNLPMGLCQECFNIFVTSSIMCGIISNRLTHKNFPENRKVFVCYNDESGTQKKIEAIVLASFNVKETEKLSFVLISNLATHPKNLVSPINRHELDQVSGAAAKLITHLVEVVCPQLKIGQIRLSSTKNAVSFYEKLGFKKVDRGQMVLKIKPQSK
jgi:hypothetical protein